MDIRSLLTWKTTRYVLLMIILGAVGSGAWEWMLKPILTGASSFGLTIATLRLERFKYSLYRDIALGFREESSLKLYGALFAMLPCFFFGVPTGMLSSHRILKNDPENPALNQVAKRGGVILFILCAFLVAFSVVQVTQTAYINRAITHFHQLVTITGPYMNQEEMTLYRSKFAQVSSRADYVNVIEPLRQLCRGKGIKVPDFSVW